MKNTEYIKAIEQLYASNSNKENAYAMAKYMKFNFEYYGIKSPLRKELQRNFIADYGIPDTENILEIIKLLWQTDKRELHYSAMEIFEKRIKELDSSVIDFLEYLIISNSWWDSIDFISPKLVGYVFKTNPELIPTYTDKWIESDNFWLQRSAILFQLKYKQNTDFELLKSIILRLNTEDEFFIRKSIGWALREYSKTNPELVKEFIENNELKPLSAKEGLKVIIKNL